MQQHQDEEILFIDGVHPTHKVKAGYGWILRGDTKQVMSNTGRKRININGAYNPRNHDVVFREEAYSSSEGGIAAVAN